MTTPKHFVNLHGHDTFSVGDGIGMPQDHIDFAIKNGADALAQTNHGNMNGFSYQYLHAKKLKDKGIPFKALSGVEAYYIPSLSEWRKLKTEQDEAKAAEKEAKRLAANPDNIGDELASAKAELEEMAGVVKTDEDEMGGTVVENEEDSKSNKYRDPIQRRNHLVLLAKNNAGLKTLFRLVSNSYIDGFYKYPRIDLDMLKREAKGNIIALSACVAGADMHIIASHQTEPDYNKWGPNNVNFELIQSELKDMIYAFKDALGEENYYLEMQFNRLCIEGNAIVNTSSGLLTLEDVVNSVSDGKRILVLSYNEVSKNIEYKKVLWGSLMSKKAKVVKITLANGKTLKLTPDHKVYTDQGWVEAQDLKKYPNIKILSTS